jgi:hypothetical protein
VGKPNRRSDVGARRQLVAVDAKRGVQTPTGEGNYGAQSQGLRDHSAQVFLAAFGELCLEPTEL